MSEVSSKRENYRLYEGGFFGNRLRTFRDVWMAAESGISISMRYMGGSGGAQFPNYSVPLQGPEVVRNYTDWIHLPGVDSRRIKFSESAPDDHLTIQGEVVRRPEGLCLFYSTEKTVMRKAMQNGKQVFGLKAELLLKHYLCANSYDDLQILLEKYPDSVIEFSTYRMFLGSLPRRNTIIWEVRNY